MDRAACCLCVRTVPGLGKDNRMSIGDSAVGDAAADVRRALRYLHLFLGNLDEGILIQDARGATIFANDAAVRLCGYASATALEAVAAADLLSRFTVLGDAGQPLPRAAFPARQVSAAQPIAQATMHWRIVATGEERWSVVKAVRIPDLNGEMEFLVHLFRDITEQKQAEDALRASESRFRPLVQNISDIVKLLAADGTILYQSPSVQRVLGYVPEERIGSNIFTQPLVHPEDLPNKQRFLADALRHPGSPVTAEFRLQHADGSWRDIEAVGVNMIDDPLIGGIVATYRDVTERRRAVQRERFLSEASALLASSLDYETTLQRVAEFAVPNIADWCGVDILTDEGMLDTLAVAHVDPAKVALAREYQRRYRPDAVGSSAAMAVLRTGRPLLVPEVTKAMLIATAIDAEHLRMMRALGLASVMVLPLIARGRALGRVTFISSDPLRRYGADDVALAEELARRAAVAIDNARLYREAQASEARYHGLFAGSVDAVIVADATGAYRDANPAATALVGYSVEELRQMRVGDLSVSPPGVSVPGIATMSDEPWQGELQLRRKDGTLVPVEGAITRIVLPTGALYLGAFRDISERKQREQMERTFIGMVAHELKNPLTTMKGYSQLILRRGEVNPTALRTIVREGDRAVRLIDDLVDATRIDAGHLELHPRDVELVALVRSAVEQHQFLAPEYHFRTDLPDHTVMGVWDRDRIVQVLENLLSNAVKYSPPGADIFVRITDDSGVATVSVRDAGIGIAPEEMPYLFARFYRAPNARESSAKGIGLGLYISKALVTAHCGRMWAESDPGSGTTFAFTLPHG